MPSLSILFRSAKRDSFYFEFFLTLVQMSFLIFTFIFFLQFLRIVLKSRVYFGNLLLRFVNEANDRTS